MLWSTRLCNFWSALVQKQKIKFVKRNGGCKTVALSHLVGACYGQIQLNKTENGSQKSDYLKVQVESS